MARKNSKQTRYDGMSQHKKRRYKYKQSPKGRKDGRDWAFYMLKN